jgi:signal peptidase II
MPAKRNKAIILGLVLMALTLLLDQWSKAWMLQLLVGPEHRMVEITPFFDVVLVHNYGISFGMLAAQNVPLALTGVSAVIVAILLGWLVKNDSPLVACALGFIMGGATGNVIDRLRFGAVADFLDFHVGSLHWPAFNIADSAIFIGVVLLCAHSMVGKSHQESGSTTP